MPGLNRGPIRLVEKPGATRVVGAVDPEMDVTGPLRSTVTQTARRFGDISGYIFKSKSPSSGTQRVPLYPEDEVTVPCDDGISQYAQAVIEYESNLLRGFLKSDPDRGDKAEMVDVIKQYRHGRVPLIVSISLFKHQLRNNPNFSINRQVYLNPHPTELMCEISSSVHVR